MFPRHRVPGRLGVVMALVAAGATAGCMLDEHDQVLLRDEKRFSVSGDLDLSVETFDGSLRIRSWDRDEVRVEIEKRGSSTTEVERMEVRTSQEGNRIHIEAVAPGDRAVVAFGGVAPSVRFIVSAPRRLRLRAETGDGSVQADELEGDILVRTGDGSITGQSLRGKLAFNTGDGAVRLNDVEGTVDIDTADGTVQVDGRLDAVRVSTGDGAVRVEARQGSSIATDWDVTTGDGSIVLRLPAGLDAEVDAESADGRVDADGTFTTVQRSNEGAWLRGRLGRGGPAIRLRTGDGPVKLIAD